MTLLLRRLARHMSHNPLDARFVLRFGSGHDSPYVTVGTHNVNHFTQLSQHLYKTEEADYIDGYGMAKVAREQGTILVMRPKPRVSRPYTIHRGEFLPFLLTKHAAQCMPPEMLAMLGELGLFAKIDPKNYEHNCLWLALKASGVDVVVLEAMKRLFVDRAISVKALKQLAEQHNLCVLVHHRNKQGTVRQIGRLQQPGATGATSSRIIELSLLHGHYFVHRRTWVNSYALSNYQPLVGPAGTIDASVRNWWEVKDAKGRKDKSRGMSSTHLLEFLIKHHCQPIDLSTEGIFRTQYTDRFAHNEFLTCEYPSYCARRFHPKRISPELLEARVNDQPSEDDEELLHKIDCAKERIKSHPRGDTIVERLRRKHDRLHFDLRDRLDELNRSVPPTVLIFFDFEACPFDVHTPYLVVYWTSAATAGGPNPNIRRSFHGPECGKLMLDDIAKTFGAICPPSVSFNDWHPPEVMMVAHNVTYDFCFLKDYLIHPRTVEPRGVRVVMANAKYFHEDYHGISVRLLDSCNVIAMPLKDMPKSFGLECQKEVMNHHLFTRTFVTPKSEGGQGGLITLEDLAKANEAYFGQNTNHHEQMVANLRAWGCVAESGEFDLVRYAELYCIEDVRVLMESYNIFRQKLLDKYDLDCASFVTIASIADQYFKDEGCFEGCYELTATPRAFIQRCIVGGRTMCANNERSHTTVPMEDFDGVSLYPSSQFRLGREMGYLCGRPKVWSRESAPPLYKCDGYFLLILVTSAGRPWRFPLMRILSENGSCNWTNEIEGCKMYVDRVMLEDLCNFGGIEFRYEILQGYYFDDGFNKKVADTVLTMFNDRKVYKEAKNSLQLIIKLLLNASYGKMALRPTETDVRYIPNNKKENFIDNHFNRIKRYIPLNDKVWRFEVLRETQTHYNRCHLACQVLSMSKRIMSEVFCTAEENGIDIWYQDTDSCHVPKADVPKLCKAFEVRYKRKLEGTDFGQFHSDFNIPGAVGSVHAIESYFVGKKAYIDKVVDEQGHVFYHKKMKSISENALDDCIQRNFDDDPMQLYKSLYEGNSANFNLLAANKPSFQVSKQHTVATRTKFWRTIHFPLGADDDADDAEEDACDY